MEILTEPVWPSSSERLLLQAVNNEQATNNKEQKVTLTALLRIAFFIKTPFREHRRAAGDI
jgi:hypothetical protein